MQQGEPGPQADHLASDAREGRGRRALRPDRAVVATSMVHGVDGILSPHHSGSSRSDDPLQGPCGTGSKPSPQAVPPAGRRGVGPLQRSGKPFRLRALA